MFIILLFGIAIALVVYNINLKRKIKILGNTNQKVTSLNVLQDFMNTISEQITADEKIRKINEILIERYKIKYSTIVIYNGAEYEIKASNVEQKHWETLRNLQSEKVFIDSIQTATTKYITVNGENERLPYLKMEYARAKSAMFFPLYIDNIYIGYWIIEGQKPHEFDNVDTTVLEVVKNNIISVLKTVETQRIINHLVREDAYSGLKSVEYLFSEARTVIDKYPTSAVCLFKITNLPKINEKVSRKTGNEVITKICSLIKDNLSSEYFFVRYSGPKFAIVFSGSDVEGVAQFMNEIKTKVESTKIAPREDYRVNTSKPIPYVLPKINVVITTYYKGTALEGVLSKLEEYLDTVDESENEINYL
ncbi:MAG: GGDEF domain-containing protein [Clostridia bacterium]|nr:GGDEF domain-containing protein [Clostridia bacterium]